ncbi:MAG: hypothetical protein K2Z80_36470 [Xanthobacteraceae bacterium]|nr:hypothetical protein [Xanthobacteraceae bacterium]
MNRILIGAGIVAAAVIGSAQAQQKTVRVVGQIASVDGPTIVVKQVKGGDAKVTLRPKAAIFGVTKATLKDVTPGAFIGVGATPQADGTQKAIRVMIFAETQRGQGEGHRPWSRPGTTMTNATVDTTAAGVDGQVLTVKYKGGTQKIVIGPDAIIMAYVVGNQSELKPGARVAINGAIQMPDGSLEATRVNVGRGDVQPD